MTPPPLLVGAALLFWGAQSGVPVVGAVMAAVIEARLFLKVRWDLSRADFNRVSDLSAVMLVAIALYQVAANESARAVTGMFQWLPLMVFPLVVCQCYSAAGAVDLSIFFWSLRRRASEDPDRPGTPIDLAYPYVALCVLSAATANVGGPSYYAGLTVLAAWALWTVRPRRYPVAVWAAALALVVAGGHAGHVGLAEAQRRLERATSAWLLELIRRDTDPYRTTTSLGQIGEVKLSDRIVLRVGPAGTPPPPRLLREAAYNLYASPSWFAGAVGFVPVQPEADGATWRLRPEATAEAGVTVSAYLRRGRGVLALPNGTVQLDDLVVVGLQHNRLGAVRVEEGLGLVTYTARFGARAAADAPTPADLSIPPSEAPVIARVAAELGLAGRPPAQALDTIHAFFLGRFAYSRFLGGTRVGVSPMEEFLLRARRGHCEYFATATVLLLRAAGIPARYAVGHAVHEWSRLEGRWVVRARDAHAWALAWVDGAWRDLDTTPPEWVREERSAAAFWEPAADLWSYATYLFSRWRWSERQDRLTAHAGWLLLPLIALLAWRLYFRRRVSPPAAAPPAPPRAPAAGDDSEFYLVERRLADLAVVRGPGQPLAAWVASVVAAAPPGLALERLPPLLALHYRHRFDPAGLGPDERRALREGVTAWLAASRRPAPASPGASGA